MVKLDKATRKANFFTKLMGWFREYPKVMIVGVDNVGSNQMQLIRMALRGKAELLNGKNTMIRKALSLMIEEGNSNLENLLPHIKGNIAFVFTKEDLTEIRDLMLQHKVAAPARAGAMAPVDVVVPKGSTGMGPEKTTFFQALNITTKITRGLIEILNDVHLVKTGERVGASEAALLNMLGVSPFQYGLELKQVYDAGSVYGPAVLDITADDIISHFLAGVANVAAVSLSIGYPTVASVPHILAHGFKNVLAVAVETDINFPQAEKAKAYLADPSAFAVAAAPVEEKKEEAAAAPADDEDDDSDEDMGFGLFD